MKKQPFLYLLIAFIVGILFAEITQYQIFWLEFIIICFFSIGLSLVFLNKKPEVATFFLLFIFSLVGFKLARLENNIPKDHYARILVNRNIIQLRLQEKLKSNEKHNKYFADVEYFFQSNNNKPQKITGRILLYLPKKNNQLYINDQLVVKSFYYPTKLSVEYKNYNNYLIRKGVYGSLIVKEILEVKESTSWKTKLEKWKEQTLYSLQKNGYNQTVIALIQSLLFGDRNEIDKKTITSFQNLGVIHILSISGLHTTIIYSIFYFFFSYLFSFFGGRKSAILLSLLFVVGYTFFVGLKPAVLRTTFMLLLYFGSYFLQRKSNIYHTLYLSAFILLAFSPNFLFDIGFQLSYLAVFFIVWLYPVFKINSTKYKIANYFFDIISVSFSAQIGTLPLILYYFNNFSLLFLVGNLLFIPFTFVFIILSFFCLFFTALNLKLYYLTLFINQFTNYIINIGIKIGSLEQFVFNGIEINRVELILSYLICLCLPFIFNKNYNFKIIYFVTVLFIFINIF